MTEQDNAGPGEPRDGSESEHHADIGQARHERDELTVADVSFGHATSDHTKSYISRRIRDENDLGYSMWAVQLPGRDTLVGLWGFFATDRPARIELGYVIHADHWGKGYATDVARAAVTAACAAGLDVVATIRPANDRSLAVAARIGLEPTGTIEDERGELLVWEQRHVAKRQESSRRTDVAHPLR